MAEIIDRKYVVQNIPVRIEQSNKSTFGKVLNIAGSYKNMKTAEEYKEIDCQIKMKFIELEEYNEKSLKEKLVEKAMKLIIKKEL